MANKLTGIKGFGEGDPKPEHYENNRYTKGKPQHPRAMKHRLARIAGTADEKGNAPSAKSKAIKAKMGKKEVSGAEKVYKYMDRRSRARKAGTHVHYEDK